MLVWTARSAQEWLRIIIDEVWFFNKHKYIEELFPYIFSGIDE